MLLRNLEVVYGMTHHVGTVSARCLCLASGISVLSETSTKICLGSVSFIKAHAYKIMMVCNSQELVEVSINLCEQPSDMAPMR